MIYIYALADPFTKEIRYIGKSFRVKQRYRDHLNDQSKTHKTNWIKSLLKRESKPALIILETLNDDSDWQTREKFWIGIAKSRKWNLVNSTDGGDGVINISGDGKRRMLETWTGRKHKPETLIKISKASKGRKKTEAMKKAMSEKMMGRKIIWADKLKIAIRKFDDEKIKQVLIDLKTMKGKDVAIKYNAHRTTISKIKLGKYKY